MLHANDVPRGLAGAIRGREAASSAESAATYLYRTLLLAPKAASQMAKTILSIPTHLRNLISAGMFTGCKWYISLNLHFLKMLLKVSKDQVYLNLDLRVLRCKNYIKNY